MSSTWLDGATQLTRRPVALSTVTTGDAGRPGTDVG
jgi:hypothetical protein